MIKLKKKIVMMERVYDTRQRYLRMYDTLYSFFFV